MTEFDIIFHNNGAIQIQSKNWVVRVDDTREAAETVSECVDGLNEYGVYFTEKDAIERIEYDYAAEIRGDYKWFGSVSILDAIGAEDRPDFTGGNAQKEFFTELYKIRDAKYLQQ